MNTRIRVTVGLLKDMSLMFHDPNSLSEAQALIDAIKHDRFVIETEDATWTEVT